MFNAGMVRPGSTVYIPINTFDSNDPSASVTATTWLNTDCHVHKDGGTTQRASSAGETLTIDFDTVTGNHLLAIDTSDNTTANFYEAGSTYHVRIEGVTVDAGNINAWIGTFSIGYPSAVLNTTIATLSSQTSFTLEDGSANNDAYNNMWCVVHDLATDYQIAVGVISDYVGATKTVTLIADPGIFTMAAGDSISVMGPMPLQPTTMGRTLDVAATGEAGLDLGNVTGTLTQANIGWVDANSRVDVGSWLGTAVTTSATTSKPQVDVDSIDDDATAADNAEAFFDGTGYAGTGNTIPTVTTLTGHTAQTGDNFARLGAPAGASVSADIAAIQSDTDDIQLRIPAALTTGTADSGTTTTMVDAALTEADADYWAGNWIRFTSGTISGQTRLITAFTPATDTVTFAPATTQAVATNTYEILPAGATGVDWGQVLRATTTVDLSATDIQLVDTTTTNTDMRGTDSAALASVCTEARLAELDAANIPTDVDAILADTGTDGVAVANGAITSAKFGAGAIDAAATSADFIDEILDETIGDGTLTMRQTLRVCIATLAGKLSGAATTTVTIRNDADTADVVVATVDADGNRSAVTLTP